MVFKHLTGFNLKNKTQNFYFFQHSISFLGNVISVDCISTNPEQVDEVKFWLVLTK